MGGGTITNPPTPEEDGRAGLVHSLTRWYAKKRSRLLGSIYSQTKWTQTALVIFMPMNDEHRKAV